MRYPFVPTLNLTKILPKSNSLYISIKITGKQTRTAACAAAGFVYLSKIYALIYCATTSFWRAV